MADYNDIKERIQQVIRPNGTGAITAADHQKLLLEMVDKIDNDFDSVEQNIKNAVSQDGKYPELTAGFANNLVGRGEAVDATINFRPSGGTSIEDGAARVKELKGNSVVWNQLFANYRAQNAILSENGSLITITPTGSYPGIKCDGRLVVGHRYICLTERVGGGDINLNAGGYNAPLSKFFAASDANATEIIIFTFNQTETYSITKPIVCDLTQMFGEGNEPTTIEEFYNRIPQNVDLYAYNEGEVIHTNAEGIKSVGFNAWDEEWEVGGIESGDNFPSSDNIRSKNFCRCIGGASYYCRQPSNKVFIFWYDSEKKYISYSEGYSVVAPTNAEYFKITDRGGATYNGGICINLSHSGYRDGEYQPYTQFIRDIDSRIKEAFPNGLRSAGNASDKVYNKNGKGVIEKRVGTIEMSRLGWVKTDYGTFTSANKLLDSKQIEGLLNAICSRYAVHYNPSAVYVKTSPDKVFAINSTGLVVIRDDSVTDTTALEAALSGVLMNYELETPEVTEYDEPFNLDYEVWDFGTEQMLATEPSAPIKASIVYGFNAVDSVRTAQLEIAELKTQIAQMQAIMASMTTQSAALTE